RIWSKRFPMSIENFPLFLVSSVLYSLTPGIDFLLVLNRSLFYGRSAGLITSLGIHSGLVFHTALAALGVSALISNSEIAFPVIKYAGAAYLVVFGLITILHSRKEIQGRGGTRPAHGLRYYFFSGLSTNLCNPKIILFFVAYFPQFVSRDAVGSATPYLLLGATYTLVSAFCLALLCLFSSAFASRVLYSPRFTILMHRVTGVLFIVMGVSVAFLR
ncbi:LysE family translocator, partial [Desulfovibrio sp. OttesenSCG-928-A18]|nr:LysE family translocator [Desulfovibrio sp. OttesenSCG-928-A18]